MPTFPTPDPIMVTIDVTGDVRITASDRNDTVVAVRPGDPSKTADVKAAEQTTVEYLDGRLMIKTPKDWRRYTPFGGRETIDVTVELPTGSQVTADSALGHFSADGQLGECRIKTAMGNIRIDQTGPLRATTGYGNVTVDRVVGSAELKTGSGEIRSEVIEGTAVIKNSNGDTTIGDVTGELRAKAANGDVSVGRAHASVAVKTANGDVRIAEVRSGTIVVETATGDLEVGIREGTAAWLDVVTRFGSVHNTLDTGAPPTPAPSKATVEVRARTSAGNIVIGRSQTDDQTPTSQRSDAP
jgi:DUF4097 and DUF4098 domain-containing protein YvlB